MSKLISMRIPCAQGLLIWNGEDFHFEGIDDVALTFEEIEEVCVAINHTLNMIEDYRKGGE